MRGTTLATAALLLLTVTGCTVSRQAAPAPTTTTTTPTTTITTTTTTTTTTVPVPAEPADGANLQACQDGTCEVYIKSGDLLQIEGQTLTVVNVSPDGVTIVLPSGAVASVGGSGTISMGDTITVDILRNDGTAAMIRVT
jgi:hypothetical protein